MDGKVIAPGWWMAALLLSASLAVGSGDPRTGLRIIDAVQKGDREAVRSLLKQQADVNAAQADGATALAWAAHNDDLETAELLIRAGAKVNAANDYGVTPLSLACGNGNASMVEKLLKAGANPKAALWTGETVLMECTRTGNVDAVQSLLAHGADPNASETRRGQTALMWAVAERHSDAARALIEHGADVNAKSKIGAPWKFATYSGIGVRSPERSPQDVSSGGYTPLLFAARQGELDAARMLLSAGARVNEAAADGMTPLLMATASGYEELALFLLDKGADAKAADGNGITALHYAVQRGLATISGATVERRAGTLGPVRDDMLELAKALLAHGANPNARFLKPPLLLHMRFSPRMIPDGATPFLLAATSANVPLMRILLAGGADPLLTTDDNTTALMLAAGMARGGRATKEQERNALEAAKLLVELGNDVNAASTNEERKTAIFAATYLGMDSVIQFLADKGAKVAVTNGCGDTPLNMAMGDPAGVEYTVGRIRGGPKSTVELLRKLGGDAPVVPQPVSCADVAGINGRGRLTMAEVAKRRLKFAEEAKPGAKE